VSCPSESSMRRAGRNRLTSPQVPTS
jgi:hypothetical protein